MSQVGLESLAVESTLDPRDWESFAHLAHSALDDALQFMRTIRDRPVWQPVPDSVKQQLDTSIPLEPQGTEATYEEFLKLILPYATGNIHPRFWGWVHGSGLPSGLITGMMAAAMNANCGGREHAAIHVERSVLEWCKEIFEYPKEASGILVTGTSTATLLALGVARHVYAGGDIRNLGVARMPAQLVAYASAEVHQCALRAMEILGLGRQALRLIPVDGDDRIRIDLLDEAIRQDRAAGYKPFCVIGTAGTVKTAAIDDLEELASLCQREKLWFHVDGAFGGLCVLSEDLRSRIRGVERSDSIGFDFHKWMHVPYDAGCVLVRNGELHRQAFGMRADYLHGTARGLAGGGVWPCEYGIELSRGFRALKVWFALKEYGAKRLGEQIRLNCEQAAYLAGRVQSNPDLALLARCTLNIVCFRFQAPGLPEADLDQLNEHIVEDLHESGIAAPSTAMVHGKLAIRCAITNHRSRFEDFDALIEGVCAIGRKRLAVYRAAARPAAPVDLERTWKFQDAPAVFEGPNAVRQFLNPENGFPLPLVELPVALNPFHAQGVRIFGKLMYLLPLLSVKSLPALSMLLDAEAANRLADVHTLVENSSGNTAFSLAVIARLFGIRKVMALVPWDIAPGKLELLRLSGAEPRLQKDAPEEPSGIAQARTMGQLKGLFNPAQYENESNPAAYERWVAPELWQQSRKRLTVFVSGLGTTGTLVGASRYFRKESAAVKIVGVMCRAGHAIPGVRSEARLKEIGFDWRGAAHEIIEIGTKESFKKSVELCQAGFMAGPSSGFALAGLLDFLTRESQAGRLDTLRNRDGEVYAAFICGDTPLPYLDKYSTHLDASDF